MKVFGILLDKPIPDKGRKPTVQECERFKNLGTSVQPTTSGAWRIGQIRGKTSIYYTGRRRSGDVCSGTSWTFEILEPDHPTTPTRSSSLPISLSDFDMGHSEPTICW